MFTFDCRGRTLALLWLALVMAACGGGGSGNDNAAPVANAGEDQAVDKGATVTLDGSASRDQDNDTLAYQWTQTAGAPVSLSSSTSSRPSFNAPHASGELRFSVVVSDGNARSAPDEVTVQVRNRAPQPHAGGNGQMAPGASVMLDASSSTDPDGDELTYVWEQVSGPPVTMTIDTQGRLSFTAPSTPGTLHFILTVSDGETSTTLEVTITIVVSGGNQPPVAGTNSSSMEVGKRASVSLQGFGYDPEGHPVTYSWEQTSGPPVTLTNADSSVAWFVAPAEPAELRFVLRVSDGVSVSEPAAIDVSVRNYGVYISNVAISPATPRTDDDIAVTADIFDGDGDPVTTSYEWRRNGVVVPQITTAVFPASRTTKNDVIDVSITATDGSLSSTEQASVTVADSPAVLTATSAPTDIDFGDAVDFVVTATDADGDPVGAFEVAHGPAGFSVSPQGRVTWRAAGPLFDRETDFNWGVRLHDAPDSLLTGTFHVTDSTRKYPLSRTGIRIPVQHDGLVIADLDGDGDKEALVASWDTLYELGRRNGEYEQAWVYPFALGSGIHGIAAADLNADHKLEILVAVSSSLVKIDGASRRETQRIDADGECYSLQLADVDRDGRLEAVCLTFESGSPYGQAKLVVRDAATFDVEWESPLLTLGQSMAVGNVDADAALEIVTGGGYVFDGITHANQWAYGPGFGFVVDTGDLDADGVEEIVGAEDWLAVRIYDARIKSPRSEIGGLADIDTLRVADVDGNARAEIIVGDGQWGNVTAYRHDPGSATSTVVFQLDSQDHGVSSIAVGDLDGDGAKELIWGSGASSSGRDVLVVAGRTPSAQVEWTSEHESQLDGPFFGGGLATIDPQVSPRLMFGTARTNSGYAGLNVIAFDPVNGYLIQSGEISTNFAGIGALDVVDYDHDGAGEMFLCTAQYYDGYFAAYDFLTRSTEWESGRDVGNGISVTHADLTGDGYEDLISITSQGYVYAYDVRGQVLIWKSTQVGDGGVKVAVADVDDDDELDIVVASTTRIVVFGKPLLGNGYVEKAALEVGGAKDLLVADTDGDSSPEIYVLLGGWLTGGGTTLAVLDAELQTLDSFALEGIASSLYLEESTSARKNILVSESPTEDDLWSAARIQAYDPRSGAMVWRSPVLPASVPIGSLQYVDAGGDGDMEISYATVRSMNVTR